MHVFLGSKSYLFMYSAPIGEGSTLPGFWTLALDRAHFHVFNMFVGSGGESHPRGSAGYTVPTSI